VQPECEKTPSRGPNFVCVERERLLRRHIKTDQEPVEKNKERLANNCFNRFGSFTKCYASGGFVGPISEKNLFKTKFNMVNFI